MQWYQGPTLLEHLETVPVRPAAAVDAVRFPIQYVIRPDSAFRGFAGQVAGGVIRPGDPVVALPSGQKTRVHSIVTFDGEIAEASHPMSVTLRLADEIDLSRGDMLVSPHGPPHISRHFQAMVVWLHPQPLELGKNYLRKARGANYARAGCRDSSPRERPYVCARACTAAGDERHRFGRVRIRQPAIFRFLRTQPHYRKLHSH